jgi:D-tagatose-1,6-bisphosphate aldolase subunit GatZ/KbaZ
MNCLDRIITAQKNGVAQGVTAVCSAHPFVLEVALRGGLAHDAPVLIEATCNQVNQFGGYTGMRPPEFVRFIKNLADRVGFAQEKLILGGDHLGPLVWSDEPASAAMGKAKALVSDYAQAGFNKIHLDCSMPCTDDIDFTVETAARRTAELASAAELACVQAGLPPPRYVIGTEVPPAGGAKAGDEPFTVTDPADAAWTIALTRAAFYADGLEPAWERVLGLVVQPGVEFGNSSIHEYDRAAAAGLSRFIETVPGIVYEVHSTDYQTRNALRALVEDHFAILKVGPGLTFAFREAVFALAEMEKILFEGENSHIYETLETVMMENPAYWQKHYDGSPRQQKISRYYSFSDRIRYYWPASQVRSSFDKLVRNLGDAPLPLALVSQFMPRQYNKIRDGVLQNRPAALIIDKISEVLEEYSLACDGSSA